MVDRRRLIDGRSEDPLLNSAISTTDLTKQFGSVLALDGLTLDISRGEVFGFLGANGAGKTTTIRLLLDLLRPTRGRAAINGFDTRRHSLLARASIGYLPGEMPIYPELTVDRFLRFGRSLHRQRVDPALVDRLLRRFDIGPAELGRTLGHLSHGNKQKVGLVQALTANAPVVILDEPTAGLDPLMIEAFCETVNELRGDGRTIFLSSHVLSEVERLCDRIALIAAGRLVKIARLDEIRREFPRTVHVTFTTPTPAPGALPGATVLRSTPTEWVLQAKGELGDIVRMLAPLPVADIRVENFRLEDYILGLYGRN
jgi:ABC-2 type transport system ATP-binding protein